MPFDGTDYAETIRNLKAARALLVEHGWLPSAGTFSRIKGPNCIFSAISCTNNMPWGKARENPAVKAVETVIGRVSMLNWNDSRKSVDEVLEALDAAIDLFPPNVG